MTKNLLSFYNDLNTTFTKSQNNKIKIYILITLKLYKFNTIIKIYFYSTDYKNFQNKIRVYNIYPHLQTIYIKINWRLIKKIKELIHLLNL